MTKTEKDIRDHIDRVRTKLRKLVLELQNRMFTHDKSKLEEPEFSGWLAMDSEPKYPYGSIEYKRKKEKYKELFKLHYKNNRHHPEHFQNGIFDMTLVDLMEMLCDWLSYKESYRISEAINLIEYQSNRFHYSDEIKDMLINTCLEYFTDTEGISEPNDIDNNVHIKHIDEWI